MDLIRGLLFSGALIALLGGCASANGTGGEADRGIPVTVENTVTPPNSFTVWVETDGGSRQRLGSLSPNAVGRFRYRVPGVGRYRLVAEPRTGSTVRSNYFQLTEVSGQIEWDMGTGSVIVR